MSSKLLITTRVDQKLAINQQLTQAIQLLQYSTIELDTVIQTFIDQNPLVELKSLEDEEEVNFISHERPRTSSFDSENNSYIENIPEVKSLRCHLLQQCYECHFTPLEQEIAESLIDNIDDNGYMTVSLASLEDKFPKAEVESVYQQIIQFDPIGVGSFNIKECLIRQLMHLEDVDLSNIETAVNILSLDENHVGRYDLNSISKSLNIDPDAVLAAIDLIKTLNLNPGRQFATDDDVIYPELYVKKCGDEWKVFLKNGLSSRLMINPYYKSLVKQAKRDKDYQSMQKMLSEAQAMIGSINKRNETLLKVASYIIKSQQAFINNGKESIKQMTMMEVAREVECHESTVSRIVNKKYIQLPSGVYELRYFFSSSVKAELGIKKSSKSVQAIIEEILKGEKGQQVYSDEQILIILKNKNINISRRTIAKYRKLLGIPSSYDRAVKNSLISRNEHDIVNEEMESIT